MKAIQTKTKQTISVLVVLLMAFSSVFVITATEIHAESDADTVDVGDLTGDTYWIKATKHGDYYELSQQSGGQPCIVRINADSVSSGSFTIANDCGFIIEKNHSLTVQSMELSGGNITCNGILNLKAKNIAITFVKGSDSWISVSEGGNIFGVSYLTIACDDSTISIRKVGSAESSCLLSAPRNDRYDLLIKDDNGQYWRNTIGMLSIKNDRIALDCQVDMILGSVSFEGNDSRLYLRNDVNYIIASTNPSQIKYIRPIDSGCLYVSETSPSSNAYSYKIDDRGNISKGFALVITADLGATIKTRTAFVEMGQKVNLVELFELCPKEGHKIVSIKFTNINADTTYDIEDPENFDCTSSGNILVTTGQIYESSKDWTGFWIATIILLLLVALVPFGIRYLYKIGKF